MLWIYNKKKMLQTKACDLEFLAFNYGKVKKQPLNL